MSHSVRVVIMAAWVGVVSPPSPATSAEAAAPAAEVWTGRIWTGDPQQPWAAALAVRGREIVAVGDLATATAAAGPAARQIDVGPGLITPGWIDAHVHLVDAGFHLTSVQLRDAATREEFVRRIAAFAATQPPGAWIRGGDWDHTLWGGELPERSWIDAATPRNPVWLQRLDGHMALANTAALRAAGIGEDVPDISGGEAVRDAAGRLTGVLKDNAMDLVSRALPERSLESQVEAIAAASSYLAQRGVSCVHHMGTWNDVAALRAAARQGRLPIRVYACTPLAEWQRLADEVAQVGRGDDRLQIGGLKGFVDGSLGSHTAAMLKPYADAPQSRGLLVNAPEDLLAWTRAADRAGLQVAVHAIGDRANRLLLDIFHQVADEEGPRDRRFRIEHAQHLHPDDIGRFAQLDVVASVQPYHIVDDGRWADAVIGVKRAKTSYPCRSLLDSGARLAFGSDWFVAPPDPLLGIAAACTRSTLDGLRSDGWTPAERITVEQALRAYTRDAAYAGFQERRLGMLAPGMAAVFVVVDRDVTQMPLSGLGAARVWVTVCDGRRIFESTDFSARGSSAFAPEIRALKEAGQFAAAESLLREQVVDADVPVSQPAAIAAEILRRTRYDFSLSESDALDQVRASIPDATLADMTRWSGPRDLKCLVIDGQRRYFRRGPANFLRFNAEAQRRRTDGGAPPASRSRVAYLERLVNLAAAEGQAEIAPVEHRVQYELTIPGDHPRLRKGALVACWLPYPQEYRQQRSPQLLDCGPESGVVAENGAAHRTIYLEHRVTEAGQPVRFWVEFAFTTAAYCPPLDPALVRPYDLRSTAYQLATAQRPPHLEVDARLAGLAQKIVEDETNPLEQARKIFRWVGEQIPWRGEREYSTLDSLCRQGIDAGCGDCGVQSAAFIALCRAAGIPARWQSGWDTTPDDWNMHDWAEFYVEPWGWLPADPSYGAQDHADPRIRDFYCGGLDAYRLIVNLDYGRPLAPPKTSFRSEPNDFQRGEVEIDGHNLYFDEWQWKFKVFAPPSSD